MVRLSPWWYRLLAVVVLFGVIFTFNECQTLNGINTATSSLKPTEKQHVKKAHYSNLSILPGELPGYTGWARPASTLAQYFELERVTKPAIAGQKWTISVTCWHPKGQQGGSMFYVRAYGRSILPGTIQDHRNGTYSITILPFDAGTYQLELVMDFSSPPAWETLPTDNEPGYEGYMLPGFPIEFTVHDTATKTFRDPTSRLCTMSEMTETSTTNALSTGRWRVKEKMVEHAYEENSGAQTRLNDNLGFRMEYVSTIGCRLLTKAEVRKKETLIGAIHKTKLPIKPIHVIFMGDSNIRLQKVMFNTYFGGVSTTHIHTNGGILAKLPQIKQQLNELANNDENFFLLFNTGLHDVSELCFKTRRFNRDRFINVSDAEFSCVEQYRKTLKEFIDVVNAFPSLLTVWQTTTAAWPKWGVWAVAWPPATLQPFPSTTHSCEYLNEIAWEMITQNGIPVMDAYWLSLSRPDHRQINVNNTLAGQLVHAGPEIYSVLTRKWAMMILERLQTER